jgi:hypothetical protein
MLYNKLTGESLRMPKGPFPDRTGEWSKTKWTKSGLERFKEH